ncbi:MAG: hypothetical protein ACI4DN_11970, partial [Lachnospiraceae bacterium]
MTIEASLALSFFLIFAVNLFSLIFLFIQYGESLEKLHQQGKELAVCSYVMKESARGNEELIRLIDSETVESPFPLLAAPTATLEVRCVVKPWTGYDVVGGQEREREEAIVYMTDYGEVYHRSRNCTHLALSIRMLSFSQIQNQRNSSGSRYTPCEICGDKG